MRLQSLRCTQVGHWNMPLQLELSPRLTIVLGDNEAGKSTLRRALRAMLFGPDKALAAPLTVAGFEMEASVVVDGATHVIHRKGRNLQQALPESLATLLDTDKAGRFASLFDLTHDNLLPQDQDFLQANGALGSLMFGARTGVSPVQLQQARQRIEQDLKTLETSRKGQKGIPFHRDQFKDVRQRHDQLARFTENDTLSKAHQEFEEKVRQLDTRIKELDAEHRRLEGLLAGAAEVDQLAQDRQQQEALLRDGAPPSSAKVTALSACLTRVEELKEQLASKREGLQEAREKLDAAEEAGQLHTLVEQCNALRDVVASHQADQQRVDEERGQHALKCSDLSKVLERLGSPGGKDPVLFARAMLRPEPLAAQFRELIEKNADLQALKRQKHELLAAAQRVLDAIPLVDQEEGALDTDALESALPHLERASNAEREIERIGEALAEVLPALERQWEMLGVAADTSALDQLPIPSIGLAKQAEKTLLGARQQLKEAQAQTHRIGAEASRLKQQLEERRMQIGGVASAEEVADARALRDRRLEAFCTALAAPDANVTVLPALAGQAEELKTVVRQTDLLVDRRMEVGEALGELRAGEQQASQLEVQRDESSRVEEAALIALRQAQQELAALWPCLLHPPESADTWFAQYEAWRNAKEKQEQQSRELSQQRDITTVARVDALAILKGLLPQLETLGSAQAMLGEAKRELDARKARVITIKAISERRTAAQAEVASAKAEADAVLEAMEAWRQEWDASIRHLPEGLGQHPTAVEHWLELQDELRRVLGEIDRLAISMTNREATIAEKRQRIDVLLHAASALAPDLRLMEIQEPAAAFARLDAACTASEKRHAYREGLLNDRDRAERDVGSANTAYETANAALLKDWAEAGIREECSRDVLEAISTRANEVEQIRSRISTAEAGLRGRWGERVREAIRELESNGPAVLEARLDEMARDLDEARQERESTANGRRDVERKLADMRHGHDVTVVAQELADVQEALFAKLEERFRLQFAKIILDHAHREASDGGRHIEELASGYFCTLTNSAYSGLRINDDTQAPTLVAVESARSEKTLDELSAGTRDQIWLALRLAGIVMAARETPFPLLLDDSLVQFDDTRARTALRLLHEISSQVQVVLFTHHDHLAGLAEEVVPAKELEVVVLPEVSGAMRQQAVLRSAGKRRQRPVLVSGNNIGSDSDFTPEPAQVRAEAGADDAEEAKRAIVAVLGATREPLGKSAILDAAADGGVLIESIWQEAINTLLDEERVAKIGKKRGTKYLLLTPSPV